MSSLSYYNYKGTGDWAKETFYYSQAVRVGKDMIEASGQGEHTLTGNTTHH